MNITSPLGKILRDTIKMRGPLSVHDYMSQVTALCHVMSCHVMFCTVCLVHSNIASCRFIACATSSLSIID